jgi:predicted transposase YbfD/YdcC
LWVEHRDADYVREKLGISACRSLIRLDKEVGKSGSCETHYYISSLKLSPHEFGVLIRGHWEVENCLHWVKDKHFGEDKHRLKGKLGEVWSVLTGIAVSLVRLLNPKSPDPLCANFERISIRPKKTLQKLGFKNWKLG